MSVFWVHYISLFVFCFRVHFLVISGYLSLAFRGWLYPLFFDLACILFHFVSVFVVNLSISWLLLYPRFDFFLVAPAVSILLCPNACLAVIVRSSALLNDGYRCFAPLD